MGASPEKATQAPARPRVGAFDVARGAAVISMVAFHLCYDLKFIATADLAWFAPPLQDVWRASISWTFLFIAGCMCPLSRSNLRRALQYGAVALLIWAATTLVAVDAPISFGIIYCMAACTLVAWALGHAGALPTGPVAAAALFIAFLALQGLRGGIIGVPPASVELPSWLYETEWLSWLGFPGPGFSSGDYYPLLPHLLLFLSGASMGSFWARRGYPRWACEAHLEPLTWFGRHALLVYIVHQPVLLLIALAASS